MGKNRVRKQRIVERIYGMKYSWKGHKARNRRKNRINKERASSVSLCQGHIPQHPNSVKVSPRGHAMMTSKGKTQWRQNKEDERQRSLTIFSLLALKDGVMMFLWRFHCSPPTTARPRCKGDGRRRMSGACSHCHVITTSGEKKTNNNNRKKGAYQAPVALSSFFVFRSFMLWNGWWYDDDKGGDYKPDHDDDDDDEEDGVDDDDDLKGDDVIMMMGMMISTMTKVTTMMVVVMMTATATTIIIIVKL